MSTENVARVGTRLQILDGRVVAGEVILTVDHAEAVVTMWSDAAQGSKSLAIGAHGYPALWQTGYYTILFLVPACILIGAIALPTTVAAAYLIKREISVGS